MRRKLAAALVAALPLVALAGAAGATDPAATQGTESLRDIPLAEWTALATGRTLTYTINGELWALERYEPRSNRVTLQFHDGSCLEGVWAHEEPLYCFYWEGEDASCFRHARLGDEILILPTENGVETGAVQVMSGVSDAALTCGPPPIS